MRKYVERDEMLAQRKTGAMEIPVVGQDARSIRNFHHRRTPQDTEEIKNFSNSF
jgi:hypothetical protein